MKFGKEKTIFELKIMKFNCGCHATIADNFLESRVIPSCIKHLKQIYELERFKRMQEYFNQDYEKSVVIGYDLMRECKACHYYVLDEPLKLKVHFQSSKHHDVMTNKITMPDSKEFKIA